MDVCRLIYRPRGLPEVIQSLTILAFQTVGMLTLHVGSEMRCQASVDCQRSRLKNVRGRHAVLTQEGRGADKVTQDICRILRGTPRGS